MTMVHKKKAIKISNEPNTTHKTILQQKLLKIGYSVPNGSTI